MKINRLGILAALFLFSLGRPAGAQERFELAVPNSRTASSATRTEQSLQVLGADGRATDYRREPRYDSVGGDWLGYYSLAADQIVRWPVSNSGNMQIGGIRGNAIEYRQSQMQIRAMGGQPLPEPTERLSRRPDLSRPILPPTSSDDLLPGPATSATENLFDDLKRSDLFVNMLNGRGNQAPSAEWLRLASFDQSGAPWLLSHGAGADLVCVAPNAGGGVNSADWWAAPAEGGYVRIQTYNAGRVFAVSTTRASGLAMQPLAQDARQLWRVVHGRGNDRFALINAFNNGQCLTHAGAGRLALQPITFAPTQLWVPYAVPIATVQPFWRSVSREIHANAQLPPAQLELQNSQRYALIVLLGDTRTGASFETIRIAAGSAVTVSLDRDAGATIVETVEIRSLAGVWDRQELVTAIPPAAFYDLSVYEEHLQSIAIDRTGKSPNPIEDVNYVPKSMGWLPLPAGAELPAYGQLDVPLRAKQANNPGAVRRLDPKQFDDPAEERPLESILNKIQSTPRKSF